MLAITASNVSEYHLLVGDWDHAYEVGVAVDPHIVWHGLWIAAVASAWLADRGRLETIRNKADAIKIPGFDRAIEGFALALDSRAEEAAGVLSEVIDLWSHRMFPDTMVQLKAVFAKLLGTDHPAAAQAAREAYEWCVQTGTKAFLEAFAEVMPAPDQAAVAG